MRIIPGKSSPDGNDIIKQAVMDYGGVDASQDHEDSYFSTANNTYRHIGSNWGNHAVTLVGWDDNFDKSKFTVVPPGIGTVSLGAAAADRLVNTTGMSLTLAQGGSTTFSMIFKPVRTVSGTRNAALQVASNDGNENPFDIALQGQAFLTTADEDQDGLNDWAEYLFAPLGFDWQVGQSAAVVTALHGHLNLAGFFTEAQVQALNIDTPLITRDPETGQFMLTIGLRKFTNLMDWLDFPFTAPGTTLNGDGEIEFDFTVHDNAAFFRLETR